ncbi:helix-turn-helix transcriptional regulator [Weissella minor]|uniref:helix-turn-helix domain-containing protein n=1 Tax=Weissella minor TaxID=1620 RepID=UPI001BB087EB|nr:helix-turn-helix transcriptional regulator [Weissella minor]MBS0949055.1 helix-turn-helix transcriptional regulator [Weissella minor]
MNTLYARISEQAKNNGLTLPQVADKADISNIYSWKNAKHPNPTMETLKKLSEILDVSVDYLTGKTDNPTSKIDMLDLPENERDDWLSAGGRPISDEDWQVIQALISKYRN